MKILEVIPSLEYREGAEVFFVDLVNEFKKHSDIELKIVVLYKKIDNSFNSFIKDNDIEVLDKKKGVDFKTAKRLKKIINDFNPDVIHIHLFVLLTYFLAFGFKKRKWHIFKTVHNIASKDTQAVEDFLIKHFLKRNMLTLVGISNNISLSVKERYGVESPTVYNGISITRHHKQNRDDDVIRFVCVASFRPQKNHILLIKAFDKLFAMLKNIKLICVGDGVLFESTKAYAKQLSCANEISFPGKMDSVSDVLSSSDVFVLSSLYEGNPISILEAINSGLPIIAPNVGGIPDVVRNNVHGLIYDANNEEQLIFCMRELATNSALRKEIAKTNISYGKKFDIGFCCDEYIDLFKKR